VAENKEVPHSNIGVPPVILKLMSAQYINSGLNVVKILNKKFHEWECP
jgi:hypothetical protein